MTHHSEPAEAVRSAPLLKDGDVVERLKQFRLRWQEDGDLTYLSKALVDAVVEIENLRAAASPAPAAVGLEASPAHTEAKMIASALRRIASDWTRHNHLSGPEAVHQCANDLDPPETWFHPDCAELLKSINDRRVSRGYRPFPLSSIVQPAALAPLAAHEAPAAGGLEAVRVTRKLLLEWSEDFDEASKKFERLEKCVLRTRAQECRDLAALAPFTSAATRGPAVAPAGWKLVPIKLTDEMARAGAKGRQNNARASFEDGWKFALETVPSPPAPAVESAQVKVKPVVWEQYWDGGNDDIPSWRARTPVGLTLDVSFAGERLKKHGDADPARLAEKQAKEFARYESRIRASLDLATDAEG